MVKKFTKDEWAKINALLDTEGAEFGFPEGGREASLVLASFNIRKLAGRKFSSGQSRDNEIDFMARFCARCDLVAIQEVQDSLDGLLHLKDRVESLVAGQGEYRLLVSDITGERPGESGMAERLAFLYRKHRIRRLDLASDITVDRTGVMERIIGNQPALQADIAKYQSKMKAYEEKKAQGKDPSRPSLVLSDFYTFTRTPHVAAFEAPAANDKPALRFLAVNAHLIYGAMKERTAEFEELVDWIANRLSSEDRMYAPNAILLADLNMNFDKPRTDRKAVDKLIKGLNANVFKNSNAERVYFPFLDAHPGPDKVLRSNARLNQTYDQIAIFRSAQERRMPHVGWKSVVPNAPHQAPDAFDYGVFNFTELFAHALHGKSLRAFAPTKEARKAFFARFEHSVSDHMPIWIRLPRPGFAPPPV